MLLALILGGAIKAQEMTGQTAEKTKKELLDLETSRAKTSSPVPPLLRIGRTIFAPTEWP
jgi:hypothetical protein